MSLCDAPLLAFRMAAACRTPNCLSCASLMAKCSDASPPTTTTTATRPLLSLPKAHSLSQILLPACTHLLVSPAHVSSSPAKGRRGPALRKGVVFCSMYSGGNGTTAVVTAASWKVAVLNSELPVLVEFFATWCGPCRMVDRVIDEIAEEYVGRVRCFKLNADYYPQLVDDHGIEHVPTVLLFKNGKRLESITGTMPKYVYVGAIERSLAS